MILFSLLIEGISSHLLEGINTVAVSHYLETNSQVYSSLDNNTSSFIYSPHLETHQAQLYLQDSIPS